MLVDPASADATQVPRAIEPAFKGRLDEARRLMAEARSAADKAQASREPPYTEGAALTQRADADAGAERWSAACRGYLIARERFDTASRRPR